jgi:hypothetical protein
MDIKILEIALANRKPRVIPCWFANSQSGNEVMAVYTAVDSFVLPINLPGTEVKKDTVVGANPIADYILTVRVNNVTIGTITIQSTGVVVISTSATTVNIGDLVTIIGPASTDSAIAYWAINILGH